MAGGSLTIQGDTWFKMQSIAERVLCWVAAVSAANVANVQAQMSPGGGKFAIRIPEESFGGATLVLKRGGTNLVAGYVAGSNIIVDAANGQSISQNVNGCPASTNQPTTTGSPPVILNVGNVSRAVTVNYANVAAAGTVNIYWGDGTATLAAAESGSPTHTYPDTGTWRLRIEDVSDPTQFADFTIQI